MCSTSTRGSLITGDSGGLGSVLLFVDESRESLSEALDYTAGFQDPCCNEVGLCNHFYRRRIPSSCVLYNPPVFGEYSAAYHCTCVTKAPKALYA